MKKIIYTLVAIFIAVSANAQFKYLSNGQLTTVQAGGAFEFYIH